MTYYCAECGGEITTADDLISVNVDGHAKAAHRTCPTLSEDQEELAQAEAYESCAWYNGVGICGSGCYAEDECRTNEPVDGWAAEIARLRAEGVTLPWDPK